MHPGAEIATLVKRLGSAPGVEEQDAAWSELRPYGPAVLPFLLSELQSTRKWQGRCAIICFALKFARTESLAVALARAALYDKSRWVRYRACELLACALSRESIVDLKNLLHHSDQNTVADARAAIDAIQSKNHNFFIDRQHSGRVFLNFDGSPLHPISQSGAPPNTSLERTRER